jgi:hypothetical protein
MQQPELKWVFAGEKELYDIQTTSFIGSGRMWITKAGETLHLIYRSIVHFSSEINEA